jgi:pyruvate formate-lyase/glycerol dehydratase family glycyl radical enzyme
MGSESFKTPVTDRIISLRRKTLSADRYLSVEQALIITRIYKENPDDSVIIKRAKALAASLDEIEICIDPEELIVGNRTAGIRSGIVFPEAGINWVGKELDTLPKRAQDPFKVTEADKKVFREVISPFWQDISLETDIYNAHGQEFARIEKAVKINQKDHAQGHICPDVNEWLTSGPASLNGLVTNLCENAVNGTRDFYQAVSIVLGASCRFMNRYALLASKMAQNENDATRLNLETISHVCRHLSQRPPSNFREAVQSVWFLFVILQMESNASSFSPGRMDQYLFDFYKNDIAAGRLTKTEALELLDALFIKFNQIVYMRNAHSAHYFAGFPIGFNITIGGINPDGSDATNELSYLIMRAQDHLRLPQPNLTARLHKASPQRFLDECSRVIGSGNGMPQIVNDENIIPSLQKLGLDKAHCTDYALVGCVELSTQGNYLGWSDAAMFNLVKVLELTLNDGVCMLTGNRTGLATGNLTAYKDFDELLSAYRNQIDHFIEQMVTACDIVEKFHQQHLPSPFLSSVINGCIADGRDVTAGGAKYNLSGIQAIQVANIADSLAVLKNMVFQSGEVSADEMLTALRNNFENAEILRQKCISKVPKYGNDIEWVDDLGADIIRYFADRLALYRNYRGGKYHMGLYTVSAHVPMGQNVGATPDGRLSQSPLADGGMSPMYGRDRQGPTAVLKSVSRVPSHLATNGTLLNMKFLPSLFTNERDRSKFTSFLKTFVSLPITHIQFNVVTSDDLIRAKADPDSHKGLTIRVAGYTAYFTELAPELQDEIIKRTTQDQQT